MVCKLVPKPLVQFLLFLLLAALFKLHLVVVYGCADYSCNVSMKTKYSISLCTTIDTCTAWLCTRYIYVSVNNIVYIESQYTKPATAYRPHVTLYGDNCKLLISNVMSGPRSS